MQGSNKEMLKDLMSVMQENTRTIPFRIEWLPMAENNHFGVLFLSQFIYWFTKSGARPFYKYLSPPRKASKLYKEGDSWAEELECERKRIQRLDFVQNIKKSDGERDPKKLVYTWKSFGGCSQWDLNIELFLFNLKKVRNLKQGRDESEGVLKSAVSGDLSQLSQNGQSNYPKMVQLGSQLSQNVPSNCPKMSPPLYTGDYQEITKENNKKENFGFEEKNSNSISGSSSSNSDLIGAGAKGQNIESWCGEVNCQFETWADELKHIKENIQENTEVRSYVQVAGDSPGLYTGLSIAGIVWAKMLFTRSQQKERAWLEMTRSGVGKALHSEVALDWAKEFKNYHFLDANGEFAQRAEVLGSSIAVIWRKFERTWKMSWSRVSEKKNMIPKT